MKEKIILLILLATLSQEMLVTLMLMSYLLELEEVLLKMSTLWLLPPMQIYSVLVILSKEIHLQIILVVLYTQVAQ